MTTKAFFHQSGAYSAADLRWFVEQFAPYTATGCVRNGLTTTFNGSNRLQVAAGHGFLGSSNTLFAVTVDSLTDAVKPDGSTANWAPNATSTTRVDVVYVKVTDVQVDGTSNLARVEFVTGDAAGNTPTPAGRYLKLAEVRSANSAFSSITDCRNVRTFDTPPGAIQLYAGPDTSPPDGWLVCNGAQVSRVGYAGLYAVIGTTYGAGNGSSTFHLPDLRDRMPVGKSSTKSLALTGGAATVTLTEATIPNHQHTISHDHGAENVTGGSVVTSTTWSGLGVTYTSNPDFAFSLNLGTGSVNVSNITGVSSGWYGNGGAHENMPPYLALNYLIKT